MNYDYLVIKTLQFYGHDQDTIDLVLSGEYSSTLLHYGTKFHSGRYPYGSGLVPYQHDGDFMHYVKRMTELGVSKKDIAELNGMTVRELNAQYSLSSNKFRKLKNEAIFSRLSDGKTPKEIFDEIGEQYDIKSVASINTVIANRDKVRVDKARATADIIEKAFDDGAKYIDIGSGVERTLGLNSKEKLASAVELVKAEIGAKDKTLQIQQVTNAKQKTTTKILVNPKYANDNGFINYEEITNLASTYNTSDAGKSYQQANFYPGSLDSKRLAIRYGDQGGVEKDGLIEIRPGCKDLSLGGKNYSQVRILVDGTHYLKGMAVYSNDIPAGKDIVFNTNKSSDKPLEKVLKPIKDDPDQPFGANILPIAEGGQYYYTDDNGKQQKGLINKREDEGGWNEWKNKIASQMLSKQSISIINQHLEESKKNARDEYEEISKITNPTIKKQYLEDYASDLENTCKHLSASGFAGQRYQVILPMPSLKNDEVYAPNFKDGTKVALVRYPHAGIFEIPILTVNNKNKEGIEMIGTNPMDGIGINSHTAKQLSGADFDGDTAMVIPLNDNQKVINKNPLKELENFDPGKYEADRVEEVKDGNETIKYGYIGDYKFKIMSEADKQKQMGIISNLITDMTIKGASDDEIARATKASMVCIDAVKHAYDYKQALIDNKIQDLKDKYQDGGGASSIISLSKSPDKTILERTEGAYVNPKTGEHAYPIVTDKLDDKGRKIVKYYSDETGKEVDRKDFKFMTIDPTTGMRLYTYTNDHHDSYTYRANGHTYTSTVFYDKTTNTPYYMNKVDNKRHEVEQKDKIKTVYNKNGDVAKMTEVFEQTVGLNSKELNKDKVMSPYDLASNNIKEQAYANYASYLQTLILKARKEMFTIEEDKVNVDMRKAYQAEYDSLQAKIQEAEKNQPFEREAQRLALVKVNAILKTNNNMNNDDIKKLRQKTLTRMRIATGAGRVQFDITDNEWKAMQSGAISKDMIAKIMRYGDSNKIRELAMPKTRRELSDKQADRIKDMASKGYTNNQIAQTLGISISRVGEYL